MIAEGIESPAQLAKLRELGCGFGQGYLLARPLSPEMAEAWLAEERPVVGPVEAERRPHGDSEFAGVTIH